MREKGSMECFRDDTYVDRIVMRKFILNLYIVSLCFFYTVSCGYGVPADETSCDKGRVFSLLSIASAETKREEGMDTSRADLLPLLSVIAFCNNSSKRPGP